MPVNKVEYNMDYYGANSEEALTVELDKMYNNCPDQGRFEGYINIGANGLSLTSGGWFIEGYRSSKDYGAMYATLYRQLSVPLRKARSKYGGSWSNWYDA